MNDLDRMNLTIAAIQLLSLIIDERRGCRFIQRFELNDALNDLNNLLESMNPIDTDPPSTSTGNLYLKCLLLQMSCSDINPTSSSPTESILVQLDQIIQQIFRKNVMNEKFKKFIEQIEDDLSSEMQQLQQMYPLYQELRFYLCCKQFCFEWLTNMTSLSLDNDDEEMMEEDVETSEIAPFLQQIIQKQSILSIISNELSNIPFRIQTDHLYGQEIANLMDNYLMTSLTLLHNLIGHHSCLSLTMNEIDRAWNIVYQIAFDDDKMDDDDDNVRQRIQRISFDVQKEAINVIRQFVQKFPDTNNRLTMDNLNQLKTLWSNNGGDYEMKINIVKIISEHLQKSIKTTQTSSMIVEWIRFILNSVSLDSNHHSSLIFVAEILDSIIDILSDESIAVECIRHDSSLYSLLSHIWQQYQQQTRSKSIRKQNSCIIIVHENMRPFLDYLKKFL